jgi:hypothetical protein
MLDQIDEIVEKYERNLGIADQGKCEKVTQCIDFKNNFKKAYRETYGPKLEHVREKLLKYKHAVKIEERASIEVFYGFKFSIVPKHLLRSPVDRHYPSSLWSSIAFIANEHTLTVDVETAIRPNIDKEESDAIKKIPKDQFNGSLLMKIVAQFLEQVFDETIILDFESRYDGMIDS